MTLLQQLCEIFDRVIVSFIVSWNGTLLSPYYLDFKTEIYRFNFTFMSILNFVLSYGFTELLISLSSLHTSIDALLLFLSTTYVFYNVFLNFVFTL